MVWNYHDDDLAAPNADVTLSISNLPAGRVLVHHYRIDETHSNAYSVWLEMGAPQQVSKSQYEKLEKAGKLELLDSPKWVNTAGGVAKLNFALPRQGVSLVKLTWDEQ